MQSLPALRGPKKPRVLVVGCGAIGGVVAGSLLQHPPSLRGDVVALSTNSEIAECVGSRGYRLRGVGGSRVAHGEVWTDLPRDSAPFDWVILAVQPPQVEGAARAALPLLAPDGAFVVLQNGLCEERVATLAGPDRVVGAIVSWGASMPAPGVYDRTSEGGFTLGTLPGVTRPDLDQLALLLEAVGPVTQTNNLSGARWSKLAINCAISTLGTIGGDRLGVLMRRRFVRRLALEIISETVAVSRAEGVALEKVSGTLDLGTLALTDSERAARTGSASLVAKHALMLAVGTRYRRLRSSMLSAIERGRTPAVDFLNGEVETRGLRHGVPTPVNAAARALVHTIARGEEKSSVDALRGLAQGVGVRI